MKSNKQKKIVVKKSGYKRSRFNWAHDVNTTYSWGEIQPTMCKMVVPNSKTTIQTQQLIRLAPMVAPTFGRVKVKNYSQFVPMAEVFPNFDAMMAQEPKSTENGTKVPAAIPYITLGLLSQYILIGARGTLYWTEGADNDARKALADDGQYTTRYKASDGSMDTFTTNLLTMLYNSGSGPFDNKNNPLSDYNSAIANLGWRIRFKPKACGDCSINNAFAGSTVKYIALGNSSVNSSTPEFALNTLIAYDPTIPNLNEGVDPCDRQVSLLGADYVIEFKMTDGSSNDWYFALALECSDYGKRLRKIIQGCGYQIDFQCAKNVSILPLLAQYKAYFDIFGLTLFQGWETTYCAKLIKTIENNFISDLNVSGYAPFPVTAEANYADKGKLFGSFMMLELGNEFYTEDADFVGANIQSLSVSPVARASDFISIDSSGIAFGAHVAQGGSVESDSTNSNQTEVETDHLWTNTMTNGGGWITQTQHGQVDAEFLKRIYRWTNRNTVLGRKIADLLRAQGLGKYVDECKSYFIGSSDDLITISDVISQAATDKAVLGEYGGRGLQYSNAGTLVYENDEFGYVICLSTIVPDSGYTQGLDPTVTALDKFSMYLPDFDALGMEATPKSTVIANRFINGYSTNISDLDDPDETFGFIPRMSKFKIAQNLVNGDFNRHSTRDTYLPYTLDKQISFNDFEGLSDHYHTGSGGNNNYSVQKINKTKTMRNMPCAGNVWRTPTKYQWLGNFDRIFYRTFEGDKAPFWNDGSSDLNWSLIGFGTYNPDNFLSHAIMDVQCYAPMKPIEDSYGLDDDDVGVTGVDVKSKA